MKIYWQLSDVPEFGDMPARELNQMWSEFDRKAAIKGPFLLAVFITPLCATVGTVIASPLGGFPAVVLGATLGASVGHFIFEQFKIRQVRKALKKTPGPV